MDGYWGTGRTEAFSDGVFAIAITLLVLEIRVPEPAFEHLWRGIADQWPSYLAYATSFLTIGGIWVVHHGIFRRVQYMNTELMLANLVLLMAVAFLPFPTKLMAEAIHDPAAARAAAVFYGGALLAISLLVRLVWATAVRDENALMPGMSKEQINATALSTTPNIAFYVAVIVLAIFVPRVAVFGYLVIAVVALLRLRGDRAPQRPPATPADRS